eukprot:6149142-Amphidinium_carterae.2
MVESDEHYWSYIRPEMEGDQGQWYRFDDRESTTCAMLLTQQVVYLGEGLLAHTLQCLLHSLRASCKSYATCA